MTLDSYLLYLAALGVFFGIPPDTSQLLMISNSIRHFVRRSLWTVAGDLSANCLQMIAAAFGVSSLVAISADFFVWIKWLGVIYLLWLGLKLILRRDLVDIVQGAPVKSAWHLYQQGGLTSLANPFAVMFFVALFPQFIDPAAAILTQFIVLGGTYLLIDGVILILWGGIALRATFGLRRGPARLVAKLCGGLMIGAAILLGIKTFEPNLT